MILTFKILTPAYYKNLHGHFGNGFPAIKRGTYYKKHGYSIRCVMDP